MAIQQRRERERAARHQLIITAARELAEAEGWEAVTTRRLSDRIEYSQPVLYSHFQGKDAIVAAVALEGFAELAAALTPARDLRETARSYVAFAERNPALYEAMFTLNTELRFAQDDTPASLKAGFGALKTQLEPVAGERNADVLTEVLWSALHGLVVLAKGGRLPASGRDQRLEMLVSQLL